MPSRRYTAGEVVQPRALPPVGVEPLELGHHAHPPGSGRAVVVLWAMIEAVMMLAGQGFRCPRGRLGGVGVGDACVRTAARRARCAAHSETCCKTGPS